MQGERCVPISMDGDVVTARQEGRALAVHLGFSRAEATLIATAISEVARNILVYARSGEILLGMAQREGRPGIVVVARDRGPGIADIARAMQDGYSTGKGLGLGLPGARRMMEEFEIQSSPGQGTTITMRSWVKIT